MAPPVDGVNGVAPRTGLEPTPHWLTATRDVFNPQPPAVVEAPRSGGWSAHVPFSLLFSPCLEEMSDRLPSLRRRSCHRTIADNVPAVALTGQEWSVVPALSKVSTGFTDESGSEARIAGMGRV